MEKEKLLSVIWDDGRQSVGAWAAATMLLVHGKPPVSIDGLSLEQARAIMEGIYGFVTQ